MQSVNEINYLLAKHVLGWKLSIGVWTTVEGYYKCRINDFKPATNIEQALDALKYYVGGTYSMQIDYRDRGTYVVSIFNGGKEYAQSESSDLSYALCEAMLRHEGTLIDTDKEPIGVRCRCPL